MKRVLFYLLFFTWIFNGEKLFCAQAFKDSLKFKSNIESYTNKLSIYFFGISKFNNFNLSAKDQEQSLRYNTNENLNLGLGFSYKWLGLGMSYTFDFLNSDEDLYGTTKSLDIQMEAFTKKILFSGIIQYYEGYYWQNPDDFFHNWNTSDSVIVRPDIKTVTLGLGGIYVFNHDRFSFKAAFQNTERQIKSAGSWLLSGKLSVYNISADSSMVPAVLHELYPNVKELGGLAAINLGGAGGYTYTYVLGGYYYFNAALLLGLNLQAFSASNLSDEQLGGDSKISSNAQFRLAIGCNKPKVFYGLSATVDSYSIKNTKNSQFTYSYGRIRFFYGRRFNIDK